MNRKQLADFYDYSCKVTGIDGRPSMPPAFIADKDEWVERLSSGRMVDGMFVYADTMSVLLSARESLSISLFVLNPDNYEYIDQNASVKFTKSARARILGLSRDYIDHEDIDDDDLCIEAEGDKVTFTKNIEGEVLRQIKTALLKQFNSPEWKDYLSKEEKKEVIESF